MLVRDPRAATGLEYGLIASAIAVVIVCALTTLDIDIDRVMATIGKAMTKMSP
jgi:Flp pilus assembly pilin Flp